MGDGINENAYKEFVDLLVEKHGAMWAAIILENGDIPAYKAFDEEKNERFLRSSRSLYWTMMSMGDMVGMPELKGKYMEVLWSGEYLYTHLYMMSLENEVLMLGINEGIEKFVIKLMSHMEPETAKSIPGLVGFGIGDYDGNAVSKYLNMSEIKGMEKREYSEEEVMNILEENTRTTFKKFLFMGESGFGNGEYMEVDWENVNGWMFPYKDMVAVAIFSTSKVENIINIISGLLSSLKK